MAQTVKARIAELEDRAAALQHKDGEWTARDVAELERIAAELAKLARTNPPRRRRTAKRAATKTRASSRRRRSNPPMSAGVEQSHGRRGVLMSSEVVELTYYHAESNQGRPYKHDFGAGVSMWGMPDGSIQLRHKSRRLWEDRLVGEDA